MKIGIDISQIVYKGTGVARFTQGLTEAILEYDKKNNWSFFFSGLRQKLDKILVKRIEGKGFKFINWPFPPILLSFFWNNLHQFSILPSQFSKGLDWFITSDWTEPRLSVNKTTIVHDLTFLRYPETVSSELRKVQQKRLEWVKKGSRIIFSDSEATKKDLINYLNIDKKKIIVNYPGVNVLKPTEAEIGKTLKKYSLKKPFILTVGKLEPRKNLKRLIKAMEQLNNRTMDLIVVGPQGWEQFSNREVEQSNIKFLGYVSDSELYSLYSSCLFFIYPSIWEGFGYPIVEAMKCDAAITCSNTSSVAEIAGDAALFFNPSNTDEIVNCLKKMSEDGKLRRALIEKGEKRSKIFTWQAYLTKLTQTLYDNRS